MLSLSREETRNIKTTLHDIINSLKSSVDESLDLINSKFEKILIKNFEMKMKTKSLTKF